MPTKRNSVGQQQPYVPKGHGDASGEYGESKTGSNRHYTSPDDVKRQLGYTPVEGKKSETPKELNDNLNGIKTEKIQEETQITDEMKSKEYTNKFVESAEMGRSYYNNTITRDAEVKITRGSLTKDEIGIMNKELEDLFVKYPEMQKFTKISVNNAKASSQGGAIITYGYTGTMKSYDLYINAGWLDKTPGERIKDENIQYYKKDITRIEEGLKSNEYENEEAIKSAKERLEFYKGRINELSSKENYNVITKSSTREERLKSLLAHELMHRIYNENVKTAELSNEIRETFRKALENGDAKRISKYATTQASEFISEANAQIVMGIETPQYIVDLVNKIKGGM